MLSSDPVTFFCLCVCVNKMKTRHGLVCPFISSDNNKSVYSVLHIHWRLQFSIACATDYSQGIYLQLLHSGINTSLTFSLSGTASSHKAWRPSQEHIRLKGASLDCASKPREHAYISTGDYSSIIRRGRWRCILYKTMGHGSEFEG